MAKRKPSPEQPALFSVNEGPYGTTFGAKLASPPHNGTTTSRLAAESMEGAPSAAQRRAVLAFVAGQPDGATADEVERGMGLSGNAVRPRLVELESAGLVSRVAGDTRPTQSGRSAYVWRTARKPATAPETGTTTSP